MKKFEFVVQDILSKIYQGVITDKLPAERELAESYAVSRFTVRKALNKLEAIGAVFVRQGAGHFIKDANRNNPLVYNSITENSFEEMSYKKVSLNKKITDSHDKNSFLSDENDYIWSIKRLRLVNGKIVQLESTKLPVKLFPKMNDDIIESSLQNHTLDLGLQIDRYLTSYKAINISKEEAELLGCKKGIAAMKITNRGFLTTGEVFIVSEVIDIDYQCTYVIPFNSENIKFRGKKE
ncbi:GntR family transcriptional regulator [Photobacterium rosenbergii]|uniref:GntR family transcriptional regulator n=1 Tax=Photobacterium rosenbergii TaxID=294936 RepID=UPI001C99311F|nr:GntR family transcriptional regulator [Photobacterium rosenbergii]MBY5946843.1 GntR family transcriptional regulator [Photobacterium rosenbergii]